MIVRAVIIFFITCLGVLICISTPVGAAPTTEPTTAPGHFDSWWEDLMKDEPMSSRALLNFSSQPDQAVTFLKTKLTPVKLTPDKLRALLSDLGNGDEAIWRPAFERLEYFDPRVAIDLEKLMDEVQEPVTRNRLIEVLTDAPAESFSGKTIQLRRTGQQYHNFYDGRASWGAESQVSRLGGGRGRAPKKQWTRAVRGIVLLEHIHSPEAIAILRDLATGDPDALPTTEAKKALAAAEAPKPE